MVGIIQGMPDQPQKFDIKLEDQSKIADMEKVKSCRTKSGAVYNVSQHEPYAEIFINTNLNTLSVKTKFGTTIEIFISAVESI